MDSADDRAGAGLVRRSLRLVYFFGKNTMECTVRWTGLSGMTFLAETGSGHVLAMDGAPDGGGRNLAPRPMEVVLAGTGGCTAYDVVLILRKSRQDVRGCDGPRATRRCLPRFTSTSP